MRIKRGDREREKQGERREGAGRRKEREDSVTYINILERESLPNWKVGPTLGPHKDLTASI